MKSNRILVACALLCSAVIASFALAADKSDADKSDAGKTPAAKSDVKVQAQAAPSTSTEVKPAEKPPIKALLVCGGCCHDYDHQKFILTKGISKMANVEWTIVREGGASLDHKISIYSKPEWWKGYDVIVHDECFANVKDVAFIDGIVAAHKAGVPAVNLHCAMHCYRPDGYRGWFDMLGIESRVHGKQIPIDVTYLDKDSAITKNFENWTTIKEELYNNVKVLENCKPLARGKQTDGTKVTETVVAWTNDFHGTRIFCTTLGHNNETVADDRYLNLVTRGLLWSVDKLNDDYLKPSKQVYTDPATDTEKKGGPEPTPAKGN